MIRHHHHHLALFLAACLLHLLPASPAPCVFPTEPELEPRCSCGTGGGGRLTVQCSVGSVELGHLVAALRARGEPIDLLGVANGSLELLEDGAFSGLDMSAVQMSSMGLTSLSTLAFQGLERTLSSLNLEQNELRSVPSGPLKRLGHLKELDLSRNHITEIPEGAFNGLALTTLKLADNPLLISDGAFRGLEPSLHNLILKGCGQQQVPPSVGQLTELSFLDLSQNRLSDLPPRQFRDLRQLTALTLERNAIGAVDAEAFEGLNGTLSSLSLLNNKIEEFPRVAVRMLTQLRVLDLGFNRMKAIPDDAFSGNPLLTLLALDGNPLSTLSETPFHPLNSTLRGLSVGGSTLVCDCNLRWIIQWVKRYNLQVTSRERNPQYCGRPSSLRRRTLPLMSPLELKCEDPVTTTTSTTTSSTTTLRPTAASTTVWPVLRPTVAASGRDLRAPRTSPLDSLRLVEVDRQGTEITLKWESSKKDDPSTTNNLVRARAAPPVHAMYRVFGEQHFHLGASVNPLAGWAQILVPEGKPVVVCVVESAQAATLSAESVPRNQCHEIAAEKQVTDSQLNKIIIGSSAAVCGMIVIAVIVFVCCSRRRPKDPPFAPRNPIVKSEHEWETASMYSGRSIPRARAYHNGSVNPSYLHHHESSAARTPDDVQSFRSLPPARLQQRGSHHHVMGGNHHGSQIALSQLSGHHSFLGAGGSYGGAPEPHHNGGWGSHHWDGGDVYSERHAPSRLSYGKDNFG